jgi:subtilisin family serine protease
MLDDDAHVHGTAVIAIALQEFERAAENTSNPKPMIMVLKVLDERGQGNIFSVSCGLSYAVQKQATLVNSSLGYYSKGKVDLILRHYVRLCNDAKPAPIPILAAAGNTPGQHNANFLCNSGNNNNELTKINTFHPASFSTSIHNVISVTTLQNANTPCFYQNYSNEYVNVGVANSSRASCCKFLVPFLSFGYEGSSFATPFVSGKMMACLMAGGTIQSCRDQWKTALPGTPTVTKGGKFEPN